MDSFDAISKGGPVEEYQAGDVTLRKGQKVRLKLGGRQDHPAQRTDSFDDFLDNKVATIEKIFIDYGDKAYVAVTIDDDPAKDLAREMGRFLFFFPEELEVLRD